MVFSFLKWRYQASKFLKREKKKKESFFNLQLNPCNCRVLFSFYTSKVFFFFLLLIVTVCFLSFFFFSLFSLSQLLTFSLCVCVCVCVCVLNDFHLEKEKKKKEPSWMYILSFILTARVIFFFLGRKLIIFFFVVFLFLTSPKSAFSTFGDHFWFVVNVFFCFSTLLFPTLFFLCLCKSLVP